MDSDFDFSQSQQATQPQTQPFSQGATPPTAASSWPPHLFGRLIPAPSGASSSSLGAGGSGENEEALPRLELSRGKTEYRIGRHPRAELALSGPKISSWHAVIYLSDDGQVRLKDQSTNGTWVRNVKVGKNNVTILDSGDSILFGPAASDLEFRYIFQGPPTSTSASDPYGLGELSQGGDQAGIFNDYEVREQLGKGSFAVVRKGVRRSDGKMVAIKIIQKARFSSNPATMRMFQREIAIAKELEHPFCVRCFDCYEDDSRIWIVLEYVDGGDLLDYVMKRGGLKEAETRELALMICQAVAYLHSKGVTHRDLKPENLLLTKGARPQCKVTDFGLAKMVNDQTMLRTMCGTPTYLAPEVILGGGRGYGNIVDAYSVGVILYSCMTNQTPFDESEATPLPERMAHRSVDLDIPRSMGVSDVACDFMAKLLVNDPEHRMSCSEALKHPWLLTKDQNDNSPKLVLNAYGSCLPFNSGSAGGGGGGDMAPPPRPGVAGDDLQLAAEDGDVSALQSAASLTSPAMSTRVRDEQEESFVDSQGFGNLRINHSDMSVTTADTSNPPSRDVPFSAAPPPPAIANPPPHPRPQPLAPLPESTEKVDLSPTTDSPQLAGQKRKNMDSHFSDSSLSELPSQPSQDYHRDDRSSLHAVDFGQRGRETAERMSGVEEEEGGEKKKEDDAGEETDDREPSTTEEVDLVPDETVKPQASPRTTRRTSRGGTAASASASTSTPARAKKVVTTPARRSARGGRASSAGAASASTAASASPEIEMDEDGGIAAAVKSRRRKAAKLY